MREAEQEDRGGGGRRESRQGGGREDGRWGGQENGPISITYDKSYHNRK